MTTGEVEEKVEKLHDHLAATQELPVELTASRWIGEAEAVAGDLVGSDTDVEVIYRRIRHVVDLLENVDTTGHETANHHLAEAKQLAAEMVDETE